MNKKLTRKEFLLFIGSLIGIFVLSRIPGTKETISKHSAAGYGAGTYGGTPTA